MEDDYQTFLLTTLQAQSPAAGMEWLRLQLANLTSAKTFCLAFSLVPRFMGKAWLQLTDDQLAQARRLRPGFDPGGWTVAQAVRTLLLLRAPHGSPAEYTALLNRLFGTADLSELVTLYASLPLLPYPEAHVLRAAEGIRTTMTSVFDAVALDNPYPHDYLPQDAWNQMVLKAVFNVRPLYRIYGLDARRNEALARMLVDYAHERWAAGRTLTPELWRLVGPFLTSADLGDINKLLGSSDELHQHAGTLALAESALPKARSHPLLSQHLVGAQDSEQRAAAWQRIGESAYIVS